MGYCDEGCEHLTRRHNCNKYHKGLAYFSYGSKSLAYSNHERCSECDKDHYIAELEDKIKTSWIPVSERLPEVRRYENGEPKEFLVRLKGCDHPCTKILNDSDEWLDFCLVYYSDDYRIFDVAEWMELPAAGRRKR